ncbi:MAG: GntR family transcriptional regulator, partial [Mesorhizobium sp.]
MDDPGNGGHAALVQLQAYLAQMDHAGETRLPAERELSESLGVSRGDLRKALAVLEKDGRIWRHVGRGTFVG